MAAMNQLRDAAWEARASRALEEYVARSRMIARQSGLDAAALDALDAVVAAGVDALLLKGPALARTLSRPCEHRGYFDIDLLVAPADLVAAGSALASLGYTNVSELHGVDDVAGILHSQFWSRLEPGFGNISIDLHWRLAGCEAPPGADSPTARGLGRGGATGAGAAGDRGICRGVAAPTRRRGAGRRTEAAVRGSPALAHRAPRRTT